MSERTGECRVYSVAQIGRIEHSATGGEVEAGYALMQRAAAAAWQVLQEHRPGEPSIDVICGPGNNGGDGYELACLAQKSGCQVRVWTVGEPKPATEAARAQAAWKALGPARPFRTGVLDDAGLVVDAVFGTGLSRPPSGDAALAISEMGTTPAWVLALDLPSGLNTDTGRAQGPTVRADLTVSFIARKFGVYTGQGPDYAGERVFRELGVPIAHDQAFQARLMQASDVKAGLPQRPRGAHKGTNGFALLIGGDAGFSGAILLAARAALRSGAGLTAVATRHDHAALLAASQPEAMFRGIAGAADVDPLVDQANVIAIGPGLGRSDWARGLWRAALQSPLPLVVDADALNLLAESPVNRGNWVLTPHPGEAARLLGCGVAEIEADRAAACDALVQRYGGCVVLKGAGSLVRGDALAVCPFGNPGMATGGMGDTLTGIIAALIAQKLTLEKAAELGVLIHAMAGDTAAVAGERGLLPSDLIDAIREVVNP